MTDAEKGISQLCDEVVRLRDINADLLKALRSCVEWYGERGPDGRVLDFGEQSDTVIAEAMQALSKVEGRSND